MISAETNWRREHAWRCWSQMQLFVCWVAAYHVLQRMTHKPMRSYDAGPVVSVSDIEWWIYEMERGA